MDKIEFAQRRYKQLVPNPAKYVFNSRKTKLWLADDVCPAIEEYVRRITFRDHAMWTIRALRPGADTPERNEVDIIDKALVRCARGLSKLAAQPRVRSRLVSSFPPVSRVVSQTIEIGSGSASCLEREYGLCDVLSAELAQVEAIGERPWTDLVNICDYLDPQQEYTKSQDGTYIQSGTLIVSLNPELHPVGNFVTRCLIRRLDGCIGAIGALRAKLLRALDSRGRNSKAFNNAENAWKLVQDAYAAIQKSLLTGTENQLRDSCTILTQVYAAFHPAPQLDWLPLSTTQINHDVNILRNRSTSLNNGEMFDRIAVALGDLKRLYSDDGPNQSAKEEAIAAGGLVVDLSHEEVYWQQKKVKAEWGRNRQPWKLLCELASKAKRGSEVTLGDIYGNKVVTESALRRLVERLKFLLPASLRKLLIPGRKACTYRLDMGVIPVHISK